MTTYTVSITDLYGNVTRTETYTAISVEEFLEINKREREEKRKQAEEKRRTEEERKHGKYKNFDPYEILMQIALDTQP